MSNKLDSSIKAILFDLDGTLLDINLDDFIRDYLKGLAESVAHLVSPKKLILNLMKSVKAVEANNGEDTNENVYSKIFFPAIGYPREQIEPIFMNFYRTKFKELKKHAHLNPDAHSVVKMAFEKGYDVVIATTPLLPLIAIEERLEWAGVNDFPYKLITTIENSRAVKPNLFYYKQTIETIGHPAEACIMVGDENKDMVAANLGLKTFLTPSPQTNLEPDTPKPNYHGPLADLKLII